MKTVRICLNGSIKNNLYGCRYNDSESMKCLGEKLMSSNIYKHNLVEHSNTAIPSVNGLPIIGTLFSLIKAGGSANLHLYIDSRHKELGSIFRESIGPVSAIFVSDPQLMRKIYSKEGKYPVHILPEAWVLYNKMYDCKRGLYFMDNEEWLHYRRILNKVFLTNYQNSDYADVHNDVIDEWIAGWRKYLLKEFVAPEAQFYKLSLSYVLSSLLGRSYFDCKTDFANSINHLSSYVHSIFEESCKLNLIPAKLAVALNLPPWRRFTKAVDSALAEGEKMVENMKKVSSSDGLLNKLIVERVPENMLNRIIIDLILAASDTTAFTTQWSIYLMSRHHEVQKSLISHPIDSVLLKSIIKETLRLYPAAPFITRILPDDIMLDGYRIHAGELLIMSLYSSGRNEQYFPNSEKFWPERWQRMDEVNFESGKLGRHEYKGVKEPNASQPFAMGLRSCIGKKLAESQMCLTLRKISENFYVESLGETEMTLHFVPVPKTPIRIRLHPLK